MLTFLVIAFSGGAPLYAQIEELILRVDGLACPFCAFGLEKKIMKLQGVTSYDVDMKVGKVHVGLAEDARLELDKIRAAVKDAGYTLRGIFLRAKGKIEKTASGFVLVVGGSHERLLLFENAAAAKEYHAGDAPEKTALSEAFAEKLSQYASREAQVQIEGAVHEHAGLPAGLSVEKIEVL